MAPATWGDLVALPENRSAVRAVRRVGRSLTTPGKGTVPAPLLLHGPPGAGKSLLVYTLAKKLAAHPTGPTVQVVPAREVRSANPDPGEPDTGFADLAGCDLLAVEDVQHLRAKHTDAVCDLLDRRAARRRPTILTASGGPAGLTHLPRRLTTRLAAGLVVRVDPPDVAGRRTLAEVLAARRKLTVAPSGLDWLARTADGARPLVGMVERLRTLSRGFAGELDATAVETLLRDDGPAAASPVERIVARVSAAFGVSVKDLRGACRHRGVLVPRQVAMYLARESAKLSLPQIGAAFGRDHSTVLYSCRKVEAALADDPKLRRTVRELLREVG